MVPWNPLVIFKRGAVTGPVPDRYRNTTTFLVFTPGTVQKGSWANLPAKYVVYINLRMTTEHHSKYVQCGLVMSCKPCSELSYGVMEYTRYNVSHCTWIMLWWLVVCTISRCTNPVLPSMNPDPNLSRNPCHKSAFGLSNLYQKPLFSRSVMGMFET